MTLFFMHHEFPFTLFTKCIRCVRECSLNCRKIIGNSCIRKCPSYFQGGVGLFQALTDSFPSKQQVNLVANDYGCVTRFTMVGSSVKRGNFRKLTREINHST